MDILKIWYIYATSNVVQKNGVDYQEKWKLVAKWRVSTLEPLHVQKKFPIDSSHPLKFSVLDSWFKGTLPNHIWAS